MAEPRTVTRANWGYPPHNRWSFQHVQELFPTCRLVRNTNPHAELPVVERELFAVTYEGPAGTQRTVGQMLAESSTDSFLVAQHGAIVTERYFNGMGRDSYHLLNSVTKSFVGMLAGIAVERGLLVPEAPLHRYLPDFDSSAWSQTTVRHLLDMTSGVRYLENYADPQTDFWRETAVLGWRPALVDGNTAATLRDYAKSLRGKDQQDGAAFHYRTVNTNVLGMVLQAAMGKPLAQLLATELWGRLATRHDALIVVDAAQFPYVGAGMNACSLDLLRFGLMLLEDGKADGEQVIPLAWIQDTLRGGPDSKQQYAASEYGRPHTTWHYRNQMWVQSSERGVMYAMGIHGQLIYVNRSSGVVAVKLSSQPQPVDSVMWADAFAAMTAIAAALHGQAISARSG